MRRYAEGHVPDLFSEGIGRCSCGWLGKDRDAAKEHAYHPEPEPIVEIPIMFLVEMTEAGQHAAKPPVWFHQWVCGGCGSEHQTYCRHCAVETARRQRSA